MPLERGSTCDVDVGGRAVARVPKDFLNDLQLLALEQQERGAGVTKVVKALVRQPSTLQDGREVPIDAPWLQGRPNAAGEREVRFLPQQLAGRLRSNACRSRCARSALSAVSGR